MGEMAGFVPHDECWVSNGGCGDVGKCLHQCKKTHFVRKHEQPITHQLGKLTKAQLVELLQEMWRWREAVNDAMISAELGPLEDGVSPELALDWIVAQHLEVAQLERVVPLTAYQIGQLGLPRESVRAVELALGVVAPDEELARVGVPVQVPERVRALLSQSAACESFGGAEDRDQALWDALLHASGALPSRAYSVTAGLVKRFEMPVVAALPDGKKINIALHLGD